MIQFKTKNHFDLINCIGLIHMSRYFLLIDRIVIISENDDDYWFNLYFNLGWFDQMVLTNDS